MPKRPSLVAETVRILQQRIRAGVWQHKLPGERALAEALQVGRNTLRLALKKLENDGWITNAEGGTNRRILKKKRGNHHPHVGGVIAMLSPKRLEEMQPTALLEVDQLRRLLSLRGQQLQIVTSPVFHLKSPERSLEKLLDANLADAWILYQTTPAIQEWFQNKHIPCLIRGCPHPGIQLPFLDTNWEAAARHAGGALAKLGHRRIGFILPDRALKGLASARAGLSQAIENYKAENATLIEIKENGTKTHLVSALDRIFHEKNPPTALVVTRARHILAALSWLALIGKFAPKDFSLISLTDDPSFQFLSPEISTYHIDAEEVAKRTIHRIQSLMANTAPSKDSWIFPKFVAGASIGRVPKP